MASNGRTGSDKRWKGKGNVLFLGGPPGATSSQKFIDGFARDWAEFPDVKLRTNYIVTNWNPVDGQKAVSALIAKYPKIDGIASDYGVTTMAAIKAFRAVGSPVPAQATLAGTTNSTASIWPTRRPARVGSTSPSMATMPPFGVRRSACDGHD